MAEDAQAQPPAQPKAHALNQYIRDLSFENILAQKQLEGEVKPKTTVKIGMDVKKRAAEDQFEVIVKTNIETSNEADGQTLFMVDLDYGGVFRIENVPQEQTLPFLLIECPRLLFPFIRRIVHDVTRDGSFPPVNLESPDFVALYRQQLANIQAQREQKPVS